MYINFECMPMHSHKCAYVARITCDLNHCMEYLEEDDSTAHMHIHNYKMHIH